MPINIKYDNYNMDEDIPYMNGKIYDSDTEEDFLCFHLNFQRQEWSLYLGRIGKKFKKQEIPKYISLKANKKFPVHIITWMVLNFKNFSVSNQDNRVFFNTLCPKVNGCGNIIYASGRMGQISKNKKSHFKIKYINGNWRVFINNRSYIFYQFKINQYADLVKFLGENYIFYSKLELI